MDFLIGDDFLFQFFWLTDSLNVSLSALPTGPTESNQRPNSKSKAPPPVHFLNLTRRPSSSRHSTTRPPIIVPSTSSPRSPSSSSSSSSSFQSSSSTPVTPTQRTNPSVIGAGATQSSTSPLNRIPQPTSPPNVVRNNNNIPSSSSSNKPFTTVHQGAEQSSQVTKLNERPGISPEHPQHRISPSSSSSSSSSKDEGSLSNHTKNDIFCPAQLKRGIHWPATRANSRAIVHCPINYHGSSFWYCNSFGSWSTSRPNVRHCSSTWLYNLNNRLENGDSLLGITHKFVQEVARTMDDTRVSLLGGDLIKAVKLLKGLLLKMSSSIGNVVDEQQRHEMVKEFTQYMIDIVGNIIDNRNIEAWYDLNYDLSDDLSSVIHAADDIIWLNDKQYPYRSVSLDLMEVTQNVGILLSATKSSSPHFSRAHPNLCKLRVRMRTPLIKEKRTSHRSLHSKKQQKKYLSPHHSTQFMIKITSKERLPITLLFGSLTALPPRLTHPQLKYCEHSS